MPSNYIVNDATWFALGVAATLVAAFVAHRNGRIQISFMRREHELSIAKAMPKVGTTVRIDEKNPHGPAYPIFYSLVATIYNEGDLAAKNLKGHCKLFSPTNDIGERSVQINRDFLGMALQYEVAPCPIEGVKVRQGMMGAEEIRFNLDIEFEYFGIPDDQPQQYAAKYQYDNKTHQMIRI
jgi:hypothetical protein